ncbi:MAG: rubredoxin-like domain-containing protein [Sphaerochaetaceae bacterium]|jgi:rubrerythrin
MKQTAHSHAAIAAICSNMAKACEKQMRPAEKQLYDQLERFYTAKREQVTAQNLSDLAVDVAEDLEKLYTEVEQQATAFNERGALRCFTWGKKVTAIHKSLLTRYQKMGEAMVEDNGVYVCEACGFISIGKEMPAICPICKAPSSRFITI